MKDMTLEELLKGSPKDKLAKTDEDLKWLNNMPVGKEI
jgi:hypothetical protein